MILAPSLQVISSLETSQLKPHVVRDELSMLEFHEQNKLVTVVSTLTTVWEVLL